MSPSKWTILNSMIWRMLQPRNSSIVACKPQIPQRRILMRNIAKLVAALIVTASLTGCFPLIRMTSATENVRLVGSGNFVTQVLAFEDFDAIEASYTFKVDIRQGREFEVVVRADDNLVDYLDVRQDGRTLKLQLNPEYNYDIQGAKLEVEITMPILARLELSGASSATVTGFEMERVLSLRLSGASSVVGELAVDEARFELSGASSVRLAGSARSLDLDASGSSRVNLDGFFVERVDLRASGASVVQVFATEHLDVDASGGSQVFYEGDPVEVFTVTSGAAATHPR